MRICEWNWICTISHQYDQLLSDSIDHVQAVRKTCDLSHESIAPHKGSPRRENIPDFIRLFVRFGKL